MYKLWQSPYIELTLAWSFYKPFEIFTVNLRKIIGASQKWLKGKPKANQLRTCACKMSLKPIYRSSYLSSYWVIHIISNHFKSFQIPYFEGSNTQWTPWILTGPRLWRLRSIEDRLQDVVVRSLETWSFWEICRRWRGYAQSRSACLGLDTLWSSIHLAM